MQKELEQLRAELAALTVAAPTVAVASNDEPEVASEIRALRTELEAMRSRVAIPSRSVAPVQGRSYFWDVAWTVGVFALALLLIALATWR